ncbi:unnamed protein product [Amoebophrya sp. A25]|nr:unnamed protein product [Amoebophrya sp. A25]|eukprot:GSA25T00013080001.1
MPTHKFFCPLCNVTIFIKATLIPCRGSWYYINDAIVKGCACCCRACVLLQTGAVILTGQKTVASQRSINTPQDESLQVLSTCAHADPDTHH